MGYLDLNSAYAQAVPLDAFTDQAARRGEIGHFSPLEWTTILLARRDTPCSLEEPGRWSRLFSRLFGFSIKSRLADPRLEELRRFAVVAWRHGYQLPVSAIKAFKAAGFSMGQVETLLASVAVARTDPAR